MKETLKIIRRLSLLLILIAFVSGCAAPPPKPEEIPEIIWPLPPEKPRIKYLKSYNNTFDVEPLPGVLDKIAGVTFYSLQAPQGVAADREGNIYVADSTRHLIAVFKPAKKKLEFMGVRETERVRIPIGIFIANNSNMLLVASSGTKKVIGYDLKTGKTKLVIPGFTNPVSVAMDEERGRIYVTDSKSSELKVFDANGRYVSTIAKEGMEDNQLHVPNQVALDKQGNIYVADIFNYRIKVFSPDGKFLKAIGHGPCTLLGCFSKVNGAAVDSDGNIYAIDTDFGNVQIFNQNGELLLNFASLGGGPGNLMLPMHIWIDENDRIYVADTFNFRVNVYQYLKEEPAQPVEKK